MPNQEDDFDLEIPLWEGFNPNPEPNIFVETPESSQGKIVGIPYGNEGFNPSKIPHSDKPYNHSLKKIKIHMEDNNYNWCDYDKSSFWRDTKELESIVAAANLEKKRVRKIANCCLCKVPILDDGKTNFYRSGKRDENQERTQYYCQNCSVHFESCSCCGQNFVKKEIVLKHCEYCVAEAPNLYIEGYTTKVEMYIEKKGKPRDSVFYGIELEFASSRLALDTLIVRNLIQDNEEKPFAKLKKDRSIMLNGIEFMGFEIVSCPCSAEVHANLWDNFFENLPETTFPNETCGMHVHVSRVRVGDLQIAKLLLAMHDPKNRSYIEAIAERKSGHHNNFHDPRQIREAREGGFVHPHDRHTAINLANRYTIEFRIFASTKSKAAFFKNLEFCRAMMRFTGMGEYSVVQMKDFSHFFNFVRKEYKEFPNLWQFMRSHPAFHKFQK